MFSSSGLFSDINCPFARRELCERPHCLYKHASTQSSIMDFTGVQKGNVYAAAGAPGDDDTKDYCLHELERINKEIETVRHEVEQEQRRLSRYQTIQADSRNNAPVSKCVTTGQHLDRSSYGLPSFTDFDKTHARPRKYVVDNSKPRTDLEYDPLSNFSADLRSYNSSEQRDPSLSDPRCELTSGDEKMNPQQPPKSSLFHKAPAANSPRRQHTRQDEPTHNRAHWPLQQPATSSVPGSQKMSSKKPEEVQGEAAIDRTSPLLEMAENEEVIIISSDDELSDSDTMEECYRIFMEANNEEKGNEDYPDVSIEATDVAEKKVNVTPEALAGKKRVAHEAKLTEEPVAKIRPQPQVLVPLRGPAASGFGSRPPTTSKIQQVQQRASMMSAAVKGGQAFVSSNCEKIPESHNSPSALTPTSENLHAAPAQNACLNYISLGTAVIEVGNNLHLILPDGAFPLPVTSTSSPVTSSVPAKRKVKQQCDAPKDKVPHDIRQRYINMFTEEFLKTSANVNDAFEKALVEEKTVYNRSMNKLKYLSVAVNALKRLKNQSAVAAKDDMVLYESLKDYILTDERLIESNYPLQHPEKRSCAALFADNKKVNTDPLKRICCRCGATYSVSQSGKHIRKEECNYHYGKGVEKRVPGGVETRYSCCEGVMGAPGCQVFQLHVHDALSLDGFVSTVPRRPSDTSCPGVYSLDCEMCYTIHGLELSRVTVVNSSLQVVYDTYVRPDNEVIDYITRFSGISEEDVKGNHTSLREVQETLLSFISSDTILVGHGLETDLCLLKLLHGKVVDTSVVFPHRLGPPHKLTLNNLTAEYLRRIIQESVCGHDTAEDAAACMELLLWKGKEDGKLKK
ncbi:RNA exonuclease 1 homolog [Brachyistius frenatus]|uniref:RNA exonuclease 1 homolog n=1 Tax=Brachyistius frenatus TaxID=100188 RepID=UPI0037E71C38